MAPFVFGTVEMIRRQIALVIRQEERP